MRLLLVGDAKRLAGLLLQSLVKAGYRLDIVGTRAELLSSAAAVRYDLLIVAPGLPDGDGLEAIRALRAKHFCSPILVITARSSIEDRISGLDSGADDYLAKPFHSAELLAHIRALLRRPYELQPLTLRKGTIELDTSNYEIRCRGKILDLRPGERRLLAVLMRGGGKIVPKSALEEGLSRFRRERTANAIEAVISRLRKALREAGSGVAIDTVRGVGYRLSVEDEPRSKETAAAK